MNQTHESENRSSQKDYYIWMKKIRFIDLFINAKLTYVIAQCIRKCNCTAICKFDSLSSLVDRKNSTFAI